MIKTLVYAYGNPGRQDDALANDLVEKVQEWISENNITNVDCDSNYQLNIEDAEIISHYDVVYFVDASMEDIDDILFTKIEASDAKVEFSMHAVSPAYVVDLCIKMYKKKPEAQLLHIKGYEWEFMESMTDKAKENLEKAFMALKDRLIVN